MQEIQLIDGDGVGRDGAPLKGNTKHWKASIKENYRCVHPCFDIKDYKVKCKTTGKPIVVAIWATCRLCKFKSLIAKRMA